MPRHRRLDPDLSMDAIMRLWPQTISVFIRHHMQCVGCPIACFHTLADACAEHRLSEDALIGEIEPIVRERITERCD